MGFLKYALGASAIGIPAYLFWLGYFKEMNIEEKTFPGGTFIYKNYKGPVTNLNVPH